MNTVIDKTGPIKQIVHSGSIYKVCSNIYMLCKVGSEKYVAVSFSDGISWNGVKTSVEEATDGLVFVCPNVNITISNSL